MIEKDDRNAQQMLTHCWLVVGTDKFLSGWGEARGGKSVAAWACETLAAVKRVEAWVRGRSDMARVRVVKEGKRRYRAPRGTSHVHVYVVTPGHPALDGAE